MSAAIQKEKRMDGYFQARRLTHVNFYVADLDAAMEFYTKTLGIEEVYRTPLGRGGFVSNGNTHHDVGFIEADGPLGKPRGAKPGQVNHIAFELETELALVESYNRAAKDGLTFLRTLDHDVSHSVYNVDPDGNVYELYADVVKDWRSQRSGIVTKPKPVWSPGATPPVGEVCYHVDPVIRRTEEALFHPLRTSHVTLVVEDLAAAVEHYESVVGLHVLSRGSDGRIAVLAGSCGEASVILIEASPARPAGFHHVGMQVADTDDLERSIAQARASGFPIEVDIEDSGRHAVLVRDLDGFLVQFYADAGDGLDCDAISADFALYLL